MKKKLLLLILLFSFPLLADSYPYGCTGLQTILPSVGLGFRSYPSQHGYDLLTTAEGLGSGWWGIKTRALYLYRPHQSSSYYGLGGGFERGYYEGSSSNLLTLDGAIGYEWKRTFLQFELISKFEPNPKYRPEAAAYTPLPALTFGFHF